MTQKGFTLIELVVTLVILTILGAIAVPLFVYLQGEAKQSNEEAVAGAVRTGIMNFFLDLNHGNRTNYPCQLDTILISPGLPVACTENTKCFQNVLANGGVTSEWEKISGDFSCLASTYKSSATSTNIWTYTPFNGEFKRTTP